MFYEPNYSKVCVCTEFPIFEDLILKFIYNFLFIEKKVIFLSNSILFEKKKILENVVPLYAIFSFVSLKKSALLVQRE